MAKPTGPDEKPSAEIVPLRRTRPCPICKKPSLRAYFPFCSKRCADVDLSRWFSGAYSIPASEEDSSSNDGNPPEKGA
jgi:endogenous inhibitor of DNA gyrase (YacG/DUF329 family)